MFMHTQGSGSKTALLIHGMASSSRSWEKLSTDLVERDFTIYTPDLPGHGQGIRDLTKYSVEAWKEMLDEKIDTADLLVGHSIGGLLALMVKSRLKPQATVLIDPMLHFPTGVIGDLSRHFFGTSRARAKSTAQHNWDKASVSALFRPKHVPKPSDDTLIVRPPKSFVSPMRLMKQLPNTEIVTLPKSNHNLHLFNYPEFFAVMRDFAERRGVFTA